MHIRTSNELLEVPRLHQQAAHVRCKACCDEETQSMDYGWDYGESRFRRFVEPAKA